MALAALAALEIPMGREQAEAGEVLVAAVVALVMAPEVLAQLAALAAMALYLFGLGEMT